MQERRLLSINKHLHKELKIIAAEQDMSMKDLVEASIKAMLRSYQVSKCPGAGTKQFTAPVCDNPI